MAVLARIVRWFLKLLIAGWFVSGQAASPGWAPTVPVEIIVPSGPGGSLDRTGRSIQKLSQNEKVVKSSIVVNKAGGGGGLALAYLEQHGRDPHYLAIGSSLMVASYLTGGTAYNYTDFTPLARLISDYASFAVAADSSIRSAKDLVNRLRKDPGAVSVSIGTSLGGPAHLAFALVMKRAGVDVRKLKVVAFKSGGESLSAVLGGHVDMIASSPGNVVAQIKSGKLRPIAVLSPTRLKGDFAGVPTWEELGVDVAYRNWRGVVGAKGISDQQIAFWDSVFERVVKTPEWKEDLERNLWGDDYLNSKAFSKFLSDEVVKLKQILGDLELIKK